MSRQRQLAALGLAACVLAIVNGLIDKPIWLTFLLGLGLGVIAGQATYRLLRARTARRSYERYRAYAQGFPHRLKSTNGQVVDESGSYTDAVTASQEYREWSNRMGKHW